MKNLHSLQVNGEPREVKMTYGLLNELTVRIGDFDSVSQILFDHQLRQDVLTSLLCERDARGKPVGDLNMMTLEITPDDVVALINWAGEHVLDFFLKSFTGTRQTLDRNKDRVLDLQRYFGGSKA